MSYRNIIFILFAMLLLNSCQNKADLTMERGIQYYEWNQIDNAILEFKKVIHLFSNNKEHLTYDEIRLLSQAHHNLSISYSKKGWNEQAQIESKNAFDLIPSSKNKEVLELINTKLQPEIDQKK